MHLSALPRLLLPPELATDHGLRGVRAYRCAWAVVLAGSLATIPMFAGLATGDMDLVVKHMVLIGFIALCGGLLRRGWVDATAIVMLMAVLISNGLGIDRSGMVGNPAPLLAALVPLIALMLASSRLALGFSVVVLAELIFFGVRQASGVDPVGPFPASDQPVHMAIGTVLFVLASVGMGAILESGQRRALLKLTDANDALRQARDDARQEAQARATLLSNMSHEIRTPMHGVMGTIELVLGGDLSAAQRELLRRADGAAHGLLRLLDDILDLAKLEAGRIDLEALPLDPAVVLDDTARLFSARAAQRDVTLDVQIDESVPGLLLGDETRLRQIVTNLTSNAVKFTAQGSVALALRGSPQGICLTVSDTGQGMTPEQAARIFSPFEQAEASTARRHGGTGLGLSICRELVALMGGDISVDSVAGEGTVFTVRLPLPATEAALAGPAPATVRLDGIRVLVADDNDLGGLIVSQALSRVGCAVLRAADGAEVLSVLSTKAVDIVLMDMYMPNLDGPSATRALRAQGFDRPILGFTASASADERRRCLEAGMDTVLIKPIRHTALVSAIHAALSVDDCHYALP